MKRTSRDLEFLGGGLGDLKGKTLASTEQRVWEKGILPKRGEKEHLRKGGHELTNRKILTTKIHLPQILGRKDFSTNQGDQFKEAGS